MPAKFAVTLSNEKILYVTAPTERAALRKVNAEIEKRDLDLHATRIRIVTGRIR